MYKKNERHLCLHNKKKLGGNEVISYYFHLTKKSTLFTLNTCLQLTEE